jgi:Flp pilus assembly protein TadG
MSTRLQKEQGAPTRAHERVRRFWRDNRGLAAVEFAMIFPIMLTLYFGTLETSDALTVSRRVANVAETAADLVAQQTSVSSSDLTDVFAASAAILTPYDTTKIKIVLTSVVASSSNVTTVAWSSAYGGATARTVNSSITLPTGLTTANSSVIMAEVTYSYVSPIAHFITGPITMTEKAYLRPRRSITVTKTS